MTQQESIQTKLDAEDARHYRALSRISEAMGKPILRVEALSDEIFENTFVMMVAVAIIDKYEESLIKMQERLSDGEHISLLDGRTVLKQKQLSKIIDAHGKLVRSGADILERQTTAVGFDTWLDRALQELVMAGKLPPLTVSYHDDKGIRIDVRNLTFTPQ